MKLLRWPFFLAGFLNLFLSANVFALGWEECKHLAPKLSPEKEAACRAGSQNCLVNNWDYLQCRIKSPDPIQYVTIDSQSSGLASSEIGVSWRSVIFAQKNIANYHHFSWPNRLGNIRVEYSYMIQGESIHRWQLVGIYPPGTTYTIIDYAKYIPASTIWPAGFSCSVGWIVTQKQRDASLYFRIRVEDADGVDPKKSAWSYLDATALYYGTDKACMPRGNIR